MPPELLRRASIAKELATGKSPLPADKNVGATMRGLSQTAPCILARALTGRTPGLSATFSPEVLRGRKALVEGTTLPAPMKISATGLVGAAFNRHAGTAADSFPRTEDGGGKEEDRPHPSLLPQVLFFSPRPSSGLRPPSPTPVGEGPQEKEPLFPRLVNLDARNNPAAPGFPAPCKNHFTH